MFGLNVVFQRSYDNEISEKMLSDAAVLFSDNYGVWSPEAAAHLGSFAQAGRHVRMNARKLKEQCLPDAARNTLVQAFSSGKLVGHVCGARWKHKGHEICWIAQLVVAAGYRRKGLATRLLNQLSEGERDYAHGILSSHPAAILATLRAYSRGEESLKNERAPAECRAIMYSSPVDYVCNAKLRGSMFEETSDGTVSCADTGFYVDHTEIVDTLANIKSRGRIWQFGEIPKGHGFLVIVRQGDGNSSPPD